MSDPPQVPVPGPDATSSEVIKFAHSYNGYEYSGGFREAAELSTQVDKQWAETGELPDDLDLLRNSLFFSARAHRHGGGYDDFAASPRNAALMTKIRELSGRSVPDKSQPIKVPAEKVLRTRPGGDLDAGQRDRAAGVLLGTAAGDALGAGYEFGPPLSEDTSVGMVGGGQFNWAPGEWTDDTSMTVAVARVAADGLDLRSEYALDRIASAWATWAEDAKDVGIQTRTVLAAVQGRVEEAAAFCRFTAKTLHIRTGRSAGNGSLMRTAPVAMAYLHDPDAMVEAARAVSVLTHHDEVAGDACALWCLAIGHAVLTGQIDARVGLDRLSSEAAAFWATRLAEAEAAPPSAFENNGWVVHALQGAWSAISRTRVAGPDHLRLALEAAVRGGRDTDTVAAIAGGLLGAAYGASAVPRPWVDLLHGWPGLRVADLVALASAITA